ncbi:MAG: sulfate transporter CysZ [Vibrionaceae bacterium]
MTQPSHQVISLNSPFCGARYLLYGFSLLFVPGVRRFVVMPLLINALLLGTFISFTLTHLNGAIEWGLAFLPSWLDWLSYLLWPLFAVIVLGGSFLFFTTLTNWIAAPFYGLLAERIEAKLTAVTLPDTRMSAAIKDLPRIFKREWQKLKYYLPKALGLLLFMWIPVVGQTVGPLLWALFGAWMVSIQYCDYAFDNHRVDFAAMLATLGRHKIACFTFGFTVMLLLLLPIINLLVMPAAVCGATALWVDHYKNSH